jgi:GNAT superfamily N-acetyltransferase
MPATLDNSRLEVRLTADHKSLIEEAAALLGQTVSSFAAASIEFTSLPTDFARRLARYPVPAANLARLAVDRSKQGRGLGETLLADVLKRIERLADEIGICVVTVDALGGASRDCCLKFGFQPLVDDDFHLFLLLATLRKRRK